jgi:hypothetical protein
LGDAICGWKLGLVQLEVSPSGCDGTGVLWEEVSQVTGQGAAGLSDRGQQCRCMSQVTFSLSMPLMRELASTSAFLVGSQLST